MRFRTDGIHVYPVVTARRNQRWRWRLVVNGQKVANGGEGYSDEAAARLMAARVCRGHYAALLDAIDCAD